jgi:hypothetical protein
MWISRRRMLSGCVAGAVLTWARRAHAMGPASLFRVGQLSMSGLDPNVRPRAFARLHWEIDKRTSIRVAPDAILVSPESDRLFETPFLYLLGDRDFAQPTSKGIERLRRHLSYGGFLVIDSAEGALHGAFDQSVRRLIQALFPPPGEGLKPIPAEHVVYKSFYLVDRPVGRYALSGVMEGVIRDRRLLLTYVQNDLAGAWAENSLSEPLFSCEPGLENQRQMAFRLGINLAMYALCLDYKDDQVHVPFIMRRRRWRVEPL